MRADDHHSAEALLAVVNAPAAKGVIGDAPPVIQEERPFFFSLFTHTRHSGLDVYKRQLSYIHHYRRYRLYIVNAH